jgi:hypothetical protein
MQAVRGILTYKPKKGKVRISMREKNIVLLFLLALSILSVPAMAQYNVPNGVFSNGAGISSGSHIVYCTAGQPVIGYSTGSHTCHHGFWYPAGITSSVDVAITSFRGEYIEDAVVLHWHAQADASFDGFNVYRKRINADLFVRINDELISPAAEGTFTDNDVMPGNTYQYRIEALQGDDVFLSVELTMSLPPKALTLYQNYPNPFNPSTSIRCFIPVESVVTLEIFDVSGQRVTTLVDREKRKGYILVNWDGKDMKGNAVSSGVYLYKLSVPKGTLSKKMVLLR